MNTLKEASRKEYQSVAGSFEDIQTGCLQRIADAAEKAAANHIRLQQDCEFYQRRYNETLAENKRLGRVINSLRGVITRLKKQGTK